MKKTKIAILAKESYEAARDNILSLILPSAMADNNEEHIIRACRILVELSDLANKGVEVKSDFEAHEVGERAMLAYAFYAWNASRVQFHYKVTRKKVIITIDENYTGNGTIKFDF